jgi:putative membrane protein
MAESGDPRVLFAAERTLLAWGRTSLALMGFGFLIERFGLFLHMLNISAHTPVAHRGLSFWVGILCVGVGTSVAALASIQHVRMLRTLAPGDVPRGYWINLAVFTNVAVAVLGIGLALYLVYGFQ